MANVFASIIDLFKGKGDSVLGIDAGSSSIKVVQLRKKSGQAVLETYGEVSLGPYAGLEIGRGTRLHIDKLAEAVNDVIRESNVTTKRCGITIPLSSSLVSVFEVPASVGESELGAMVAIEARKYIPVQMSEVTLDWRLIPKPVSGGPGEDAVSTGEFSGRNEVLTVAIHNEILNRYGELAKQAGLETIFLELEVFSAMRAVAGNSGAPYAVIDFGASSSKIYISELGIIRASHAINFGAQDITLALSRSLGIGVAEAERLKRESGLGFRRDGMDASQIMSGGLEMVFSESAKLIKEYEHKHGKMVGGVTLSGGGVHLKGLVEMARSALPSPIFIANPFVKTGAPAFMEKVLSEAGPEFSVAIGAALRALEEQN